MSQAAIQFPLLESTLVEAFVSFPPAFFALRHLWLEPTHPSTYLASSYGVDAGAVFDPSPEVALR
jgi:hypothetical protein